MNPTFKKIVPGLLVALALSGAAHAAGILFTTNDGNPQPFTWDTSGGPIPAYTDGGGAFTFDFDGVTPFLTIERANEITQFALEQWSAVPTSTFAAQVTGTIESLTGIADITAENAGAVIGPQNGYGMWVVYDTDGDILEEVFGVPRTAILGISFPEWADADGTITESTTLLNGWFVSDQDTLGERVAGVFTHELGHAINLGHSQVNGQLAFSSPVFAPKYPGVPDCGVDPVHNWNSPPSVPNPADPDQVETMYPFIGHTDPIGKSMSFVNTPDDIASISNLYPTADYFSSTGTITGRLFLKDGKTEFTGINVVARNVNDLTGDAISQLTGQATQGKLGPDGRYTIHGLTPGEEYVVYIERIVAGGFSPTPMQLISVAEYWNADETNVPAQDDPCDATSILAEAGVTKTADIVFNGYVKGIDYTPIGPFFLTDLAKNGKSSLGVSGSTPFLWDEKKGIEVIPNATVTQGAMNRNGTVLALESDPDGDGIGRAGLWTAARGFDSFGFFGETECGGSGAAGVRSSTAWAMSDDARTVVGIGYWDRDGDGGCQRQRVDPPEINGFVWTPGGGMRLLPLTGYERTPAFIRAHGVSGNGKVILGTDGNSRALAWVESSFRGQTTRSLADLATTRESEVAAGHGFVELAQARGNRPVEEYEFVDLASLYPGAREVFASNYQGTRVAIGTTTDVVLWNPTIDGPEAFQPIGGLKWCEDLDFIRFGTNFCDILPPEEVQAELGPIPVLPTDMTDDGRIIIGRAGSFFTGFAGAIWMEPIGWMNWSDFFRKQGVAEAQDLPMDNPISISAKGTEVVGGLAGATFTWLTNLDQVFVCQDGQSIQTGFPNGLFAKLEAGAEFGRCEHLD